MVKHGMLDVSGCHFSSCDIDAVLDFVLFFFLFFSFSELHVRFYVNK